MRTYPSIMAHRIPTRIPRTNEVSSFQTSDRKTVVAVVQNVGGGFRVYLSQLRFDDEEAVYYWSDDMMPSAGVFGSVKTAKNESERLLGPLS
ncbi:MAG: hypothetical protein AAFY82_02300 [Pseudomonadota bacterium]